MNGRTTLAALILGCATTLGGCSTSMYLGGTSTERTGVSTYAGDTLSTTDRVPVGRIFNATKAACDEMGLLIVGEESESFVATVTARDSEDRKLTMSLQATTERETMISVRVQGGERGARKETAVAMLKAIRGNY